MMSTWAAMAGFASHRRHNRQLLAMVSFVGNGFLAAVSTGGRHQEAASFGQHVATCKPRLVVFLVRFGGHCQLFD
jgi:hypothetical protein